MVWFGMLKMSQGWHEHLESGVSSVEWCLCRGVSSNGRVRDVFDGTSRQSYRLGSVPVSSVAFLSAKLRPCQLRCALLGPVAIGSGRFSGVPCGSVVFLAAQYSSVPINSLAFLSTQWRFCQISCVPCPLSSVPVGSVAAQYCSWRFSSVPVNSPAFLSVQGRSCQLAFLSAQQRSCRLSSVPGGSVACGSVAFLSTH
jgi:hypothetical protein